MPVVMSGNYIFVKPGDKMYKVASNFTNYVELGVKGVTPYYLEARVKDDEFQINATLLNSSGAEVCRVVNNFPDGQAKRHMTPSGYRIEDLSGELLLGMERHNDVCHLKGTLYGASGEVVAQAQGDDYLVSRGPAVIGKSGSARGIVLG